MKQCPKCLTDHSKVGIFCSRKCANSRAWSQADKDKKSLANKGNIPWSKGLTVGTNAARNKSIAAALNERSFARFLDGQITERAVIRKHLTNTCGYHCKVCGVSEWNDLPITLQVDHIDGNAGNNVPDNLRLICPNCHSQTSTFGARNKGSGRKARGIKLS